MERQKFEESWKQSFKDAEVEPAESLWTNIELDLEKAEGKAMKKRVLFFKLLAAASVAFAMTFAGVGVYFMNERNIQPQLADGVVTNKESIPQASATKPAAETSSEVAANDENQEQSTGATQDVNSNQPSSEKELLANRTSSLENSSATTRNSVADNLSTTRIDRTNAINGNGNDGTLVSEKSTNDQANVAAITSDPNSNEVRIQAASTDYDLLSTHGGLPRLVTLREPSLVFSSPTPVHADPVAVMMARLDDEEKKYNEKDNKEKKSSNENVWTSVGFAAGSFNTVTSGNASPPPVASAQASNSFVLSNSIVHDQSSASGVAYSVGLSLGGKISSRWVLQGGVNYLSQSSDYTTNAVVGSADYQSFKVASINEVSKINDAGKTDSRLVNTASYGVNSNVQYLSVPVQAGYLVINRDFGVQFNAGLSTDLFLQNTLTPDGGTLDKTSQGRGDDSPYRTVNFSGLVGTELSYRFGQHYRVALNPGLRYPFNSIYKSDISVSAMPLTFDVGLRFRYIFN